MSIEGSAVRIKPSFYISASDWRKMISLAQIGVDRHGSEISGMALMRYSKKNNRYEIFSPQMLEQEGSAGSTLLSKDALAVYYSQMDAKYGDEIKFVWWHSHCDFGAFMSGTDTETIREFGSSSWTASLVLNIHGDHVLRITFFEPVEAHIDAKLTIDYSDAGQTDMAALEDEFALNFTKESLIFHGAQSRDFLNDKASVQTIKWRYRRDIWEAVKLHSEGRIRIEKYVELVDSIDAVLLRDHGLYIDCKNAEELLNLYVESPILGYQQIDFIDAGPVIY